MVNFINTVPVQLNDVGPDCAVVILQQLNTPYVGYHLQSSEGYITTIHDLQGNISTWIEVPDTGGAPRRVEVP